MATPSLKSWKVRFADFERNPAPSVPGSPPLVPINCPLRTISPFFTAIELIYAYVEIYPSECIIISQLIAPEPVSV